MKKYLIGSGLILGCLALTILVTVQKDRKIKAQHSRVDHYIQHVTKAYTDLKKNDIVPTQRIKFLNPDNTHGLVGLDPWGHPYEYFIVSKDKSITVTLWSKGSDSKKQLQEKDLNSNNLFFKKGDDFIYSKKIRI